MTKKDINQIKHTKKLVTEETHKRRKTTRKGRAVLKSLVSRGDSVAIDCIVAKTIVDFLDGGVR